MIKKTVLKVDIHCLKCKKKIIKTVSSLQGIDKIEADEGKGTLTVTGNADPYDIIIRIRKAGKHVEVVSIGPPPAPPAPPKQDNQPKKPEEKKKAEENKKPDQVSTHVPYMQVPYYYPQYDPVTAVHMNRLDEPNTCTIL